MSRSSVPTESPSLPASVFSLPTPSEEIQRVQRSLDTLIHRASHDLKGPLASISGLAQIAVSSDQLQEVRGYLDMIHRLSNKLMIVLEELVEVNHMQAVPVAPRWVNLREMLEDCLAAFSEWPEARDISLLVDAPPCKAFVDAHRLRSMLHHLLTNSILYHDPNKSQRWIRLGLQRDDKGVSISVQDNGRGMSPRFLAQAFDMFSRADASSKGSGLGLYLAKEAAITMGAALWLESELGKGTSAFIRLEKHGD